MDSLPIILLKDRRHGAHLENSLASEISLAVEVQNGSLLPAQENKGSNHLQVTIRLFALAKQKAGRSEFTFELPDSSTVAHLRQEIARACPELAPLLPSLMIAIDSEYADDQRVVEPGQEIALIPPVSGGAQLEARNHSAITSHLQGL